MRSGWASAWALASALAFVALVACGDDDDDEIKPNPLQCNEYVPGESVGRPLGGSAASYAFVQAVADYAVVARVTTLRLSVLCTQIATELGENQGLIEEALSANDAEERSARVCQLAEHGIRNAVATTPAPFPNSSCLPLAAFEASCVNRFGPAAAFACSASAHARAECPEPRSERSYVAELATLRARIALLSDSKTFSVAVSQITDIKAACIPVVVGALVTVSRSIDGARVVIEQLVDAGEGRERDR